MERLWMVLEDDPVIRSILTMLCSLWEVKPLVFADGHEAWEWLNRVENGAYRGPLPEVALLDIRVPGPLGHHIARRMREVSPTSRIPIIIMTAYRFSAPERAEIVEAAQPAHIVAKPLPEHAEFRALIEQTIAASRSRAGSPQATTPPVVRDS